MNYLSQWSAAQRAHKYSWLGIAFFTLLAIPTILHTAYTLNAHHLNVQAQQSANAVVQDVSNRIGVIRTLLASLEGLHYVSPNLDKAKFHLFARDFLSNAPYIKSIGRYESISREDRQSYESRMVEQGYPGFQISEITRNGEILPRGERSHYYPISLLEPLKPDNLALVGVDFGSESGMAGSLDTIAKDNAVLIAPLPGNWPGTATLVAFNPVYRGKEAPDSEQESLRQTSGGFWINIDIESLLNEVSEQIKGFDVKVQILDNDEQQLIHSRQSTSAPKLHLAAFFAKRVITEQWNTGGSAAIIVSMEQAVGFKSKTLILVALALAATIFVATLLSMHLLNEQKTVSARVKDQLKIANEREKAQKTLNTVQDAIITLDPNLNIAHINSSAAVLFNTKSSLSCGKPMEAIARFRELNSTIQNFNIAQVLGELESNGKREYDLVPFGYSNDDFVLRVSLSTSRSHEGKITGHVLVFRDISHERRMSRKLAYQANYDSLTGCTNRYYFEQSMDGLISNLKHSNAKHSFCYIDIDQFKVVNDTCGHRAGDQLLIELTKKLKVQIRDQDILSRLGGDEFGIILTNVDREQANVISNRIYDFFQTFVFKHEEFAFSVTASIGVVHIDQNCSSTQEVLAAADIACYSVKDSGRNKLSIFSQSNKGMAERSAELNWLPRLQTALQQNLFRLNMQPIVALQELSSDKPVDQCIKHYEFLLRLADADGSDISPWQIIQAAERYDLMLEIDRWVIRNALSTVSSLQSGTDGQCTYSINLSGQSAADPGLKSYIGAQLQEHQIDPSNIWFELTETAAISHFSIAVDLIKSIRALGAKVALDDFGSGLSSFGYLKNLPVDIIKIDGQFVKEMAHNPIDREMVRAIHQVGRSMSIESVAEFVEDQATVDELMKIGVNYAQGYFFGKPTRVEDVAARLAGQSKAA
ncbi:MAG: EAL domain-containing protein [Granulosicoccus sp.]|nr:EAL domain-containing protein [Granulosicoccus sp.]